MNTLKLNVIHDDNLIIQSGGGTPDTPSTSWTGHADAEGLKAIGWTDEDIAYYQANGVNWNEEDDEYHKVTDDNKALYGVLTADNISTYIDRIVYLPKIDTSGVTDMYGFIYDSAKLVAVPMLDTSNVTDMSYMFSYCVNLTCIPPFDTSKVTDISGMVDGCSSLMKFPKIQLSNIEDIYDLVMNCISLEEINTELGIHTYYSNMFNGCYSLKSIPLIDCSITGERALRNTFLKCYTLVNVKIKNIKEDVSFADSPLISKESLLYIINNEAATSPIVITLNSNHNGSYDRLATDTDIVTALANHPNVSLAK